MLKLCSLNHSATLILSSLVSYTGITVELFLWQGVKMFLKRYVYSSVMIISQMRSKKDEMEFDFDSVPVAKYITVECVPSTSSGNKIKAL